MLALALSTTSPNADEKTALCKTAAPPLTGLRRPLVLEPPLPTALDTGVLSAALALALFTLVVAAIIFGSKTMQLRGRMGEVSLDFKNSWGANVTLGTAILTALTSRAVLAHDQYSTSSTAYSILAIVLAAFVPLGIALYSLLKPRVSTGGGSQAQGYVSMYLLSAAIVLWGAFGEMLLLGMVFGELSLARVMSPEAAYLLILLTKVLIVALMAYAMMTAYATVKETSAVAGVNTERPPAAVL